jgi:hypothetical protein
MSGEKIKTCIIINEEMKRKCESVRRVDASSWDIESGKIIVIKLP